jgi:hypothetical protein
LVPAGDLPLTSNRVCFQILEIIIVPLVSRPSPSSVRILLTPKLQEFTVSVGRKPIRSSVRPQNNFRIFLLLNFPPYRIRQHNKVINKAIIMKRGITKILSYLSSQTSYKQRNQKVPKESPYQHLRSLASSFKSTPR